MNDKINALFNNGVGFNVYIELQKQRELFWMLMPFFKKIDCSNEGAYFNYENYQMPINKDHVKIWVRSRQIDINEIKNILNKLGLVEKPNEDANITDYYTFFSYAAGNLPDFDDESYIQQKEDGTKYAIEIITELKLKNCRNFDLKKKDIAKKIKKDKPNLINDFPAFHLVMNPLSFFEDRGSIEKEMINLIKNLL